MKDTPILLERVNLVISWKSNNSQGRDGNNDAKVMIWCLIDENVKTDDTLREIGANLKRSEVY
jgi:hypothetical protein